MKLLLAVAVVLILAGCDKKIVPQENPKYQLKNYKCSDAQSIQVERLFRVCNESDYISSFCYAQAVIASCDYTGGE